MFATFAVESSRAHTMPAVAFDERSWLEACHVGPVPLEMPPLALRASGGFVVRRRLPIATAGLRLQACDHSALSAANFPVIASRSSLPPPRGGRLPSPVAMNMRSPLP